MAEERQRSIHRILPTIQDRRASWKGDTHRAPRPTPEQPLIVSASELRDFLRCRVRWWWRHQCRLEPIGGKEALDMGTLVHSITEAWYMIPRSLRTVKAMDKIARNAIKITKLRALDSQARELVEAMCIGYAAWALGSHDDSDKAIGKLEVYPEEEFDLPLVADGSIRLRGKIDARFQQSKYVMAMDELKTAGQFRDKGLDTLLQLSVYLWALRTKFPKMKRYKAYYTEMRKQLPTERVRAPLFQRQEVERTDGEIDQWVLDIQRAALDMIDPAIYPNPNANCSWDCDFQIPCMQRGTPDLLHILQTGYQEKVRT